MNALAHSCLECGKPVSARRSTQHFCSQQCRLAFNNRRLQRGAQLYDLFMSMRYERDKAKELGLWAIMCRMAKDMRGEDEIKREGRKSWQRPRDVLERLPVVMVTKDVFVGNDLTGRGRR
jgi:predicted nucleic acid-binding Zn ribbon protein